MREAATHVHRAYRRAICSSLLPSIHCDNCSAKQRGDQMLLALCSQPFGALGAPVSGPPDHWGRWVAPS
jgi:hypothetical protein